MTGQAAVLILVLVVTGAAVGWFRFAEPARRVLTELRMPARRPTAAARARRTSLVKVVESITIALSSEFDRTCRLPSGRYVGGRFEVRVDVATWSVVQAVVEDVTLDVVRSVAERTGLEPSQIRVRLHCDPTAAAPISVAAISGTHTEVFRAPKEAPSGSEQPTPTRLELVATNVVGDASGNVPLPDGKEVFLGRADGGLADPWVSEHHVGLTARGSSVIVLDLGSTNGTFIDGERVADGASVLRPGGLLTIGHSTYVLVDNRAPVLRPAAGVEDVSTAPTRS